MARNDMEAMYGGIEAGGTKFLCATGTGPDNIVAHSRIPTTTPGETIRKVIAFFREQQRRSTLSAVGVGSFGPMDLDPSSPAFGRITSTPKPGWSGVDLLGAVSDGLSLPVRIDTDVNAAALGEHLWGAGRGVESFIYLTIGTGIGGGGLINGRPMHGLLHPEMGHIFVPHDAKADPYPGCCPFHGDCLEGLASGPALKERWGRSPDTLPADHKAWRLEARYLALGLVNFICTLSPRRIIMGGGVMEQEQLLPLVHSETQRLLNGYIGAPAILSDIHNFIVRPGLGEKAGLLGAIALAKQPHQ